MRNEVKNVTELAERAPRTKRTPAQKLELGQKCWQLSLENHSYADISAVTGVATSQVREYIGIWAREIAMPDADVQRQQMNEHLLDTVQVMREVMTTSLKDADRVAAARGIVGAVGTYAKINGLEAPQRVEHSMSVAPEVASLIEQARARKQTPVHSPATPQVVQGEVVRPDSYDPDVGF